MQEIKLANVTIDCGDEKALCSFYSQLLGWESMEMFGHAAVRGPGGLIFLFVQEEDYVPCGWPEQEGQQQKQIHFDFLAEDVPAAVARAEELGAVRSREQFGGQHFVTMLDPAGHPFCLCAHG